MRLTFRVTVVHEGLVVTNPDEIASTQVDPESGADTVVPAVRRIGVCRSRTTVTPTSKTFRNPREKCAIKN